MCVCCSSKNPEYVALLRLAKGQVEAAASELAKAERRLQKLELMHGTRDDFFNFEYESLDSPSEQELSTKRALEYVRINET